MQLAAWLANNILSQAPILIGLVACVGLIAQQKPFTSVLSGTLKTITGFVIMTSGSSVLVGMLNNFLSPVIVQAFGLEAPAAMAGMGYDKFLLDWGGIAALIMTVGFLVNLALARFTPFKYVYLTGHLMWLAAQIVTCVMLEIKSSMPTGTIVLIGGLICGVYWTLQPAYMHGFMKKLTNQDAVAYGHTSSSPAFLGAFLGKFVGKAEDGTEKLKLPDSLNFFRDVTVSIALIMSLVTVIAVLFAGPEFVSKFTGGKNYIVYAIMQGVTFAAGTAILLTGVRLVLGEIIPAFRGISAKLVPNAKPALDCPVVFSYAPTAVLVGFLSAFVSFVILMFVFSATGYAIIIPPLVMLFFPGGASGVFGNSTGGVKGAILGGSICGILLAFGQAIGGRVLGATVPQLAMRADPDLHILMIVVKYIGQLFVH